MIFSPIDEARFQAWYRALPAVAQGQMNPNPDDPEHFYDMRKYWAENGQSVNAGQHFPSQYKIMGNPRDFLGGVDTVNDYGHGQEVADLLDPQNLARGTRGR